MAQFDTNKQTLNRNNNVLYEVQMVADQYGRIHNEGATSRSAFGENISIPVNPVFQLDGLYGLDPQLFETFTGTFTGNPGTATTTDTLMQVTTDATGIGSYGVIRSRRAVRYRPGQGALGRFTAKFSTGVAGYTQRAGFFTQEQAVQVGYDGESFGVLRQNGGKAHIEILTVTATASETVQVELDGVSTGVAILSTDTNQEAAVKIADAFAGNASWIVETYDDKVCFLATSVGPKAGAFSYTGTSATLTTQQTGVAHTDLWTPQAEFNQDTLDGNGPSKVTIDPQKLNVYQINFRWLGAGEIRYAIENPTNGDMIHFHHEHYSNRNTDVHIDNPSLKIGYVAASLGGDGTSIVVEGASMMGAIEGLINTTKLPTATFRESTTNLNANTWYHVLTAANNRVFRNKINTREIILKNINCAFSGTGPVTVALILNPTGVADTREFNSINEFSSVSTSNTTSVVTLGDQRLMYIFDVEAGGSGTQVLEDLRIAIPPGNEVSVLIRSSQQITRNAISMSWIED
jgi:hypothetical protein